MHDTDIMEFLAEHEKAILSGNRRTLSILVEKFNRRIDTLEAEVKLLQSQLPDDSCGDDRLI